jgi:SAM-dependent methyltransferase
MAGRVPPEVSAALAERAASLRGRATGRVLDLDTDPLDDADGAYDTIYAFLQAPHRRDLDRFYRRLHELLAPSGLMYVLEPTMRTGPLGRALGIGGRLARPITGLHLDRDVPQSIRRSGLFVSDLHRFEIAPVAAPFRPFVEAWAQFPTPAPEVGVVS